MINQANIKYRLQVNINIQIFILKQIFIWSLTFKNKNLLHLTNNNPLQITTHCK